MWSRPLEFELAHVRKKKQLEVKVERDMAKRDTHTKAVLKSGQDLVDSGHYSSDTIQSRMISIQNKWINLNDVAAYRKKKIQENHQLQQFIADYNDIMS